MASINSIQDSEVSYITGIAANGTLVGQSFWTWNEDNPATYDPATNYTAKFGAASAGTGATISYAFDPASSWSDVERGAFAATAALWSAVANVTFIQSTPFAANVLLSRGSDGSASGGQNRFFPGTTGTLVTGIATKASIEIDTSIAGFGPLGAAFSEYGGYPYSTLLHEWGHVLGLGHGGPYDESLDFAATPRSSFDTRAWTVMSYNDPDLYGDFFWGTSRSSNGQFYGNSPTTPMPLDIVAMQRIYGTAINTPLSGGQTFGFHSNVDGPIAKFFDFNQNSRPVVTLWDKGLNNTLDLSGFSSGSNVDLHDGAFSSVAGMTNNVAIAYGTRIDTAITGPGADTISGNDNSDVILGGAGADSISGGSGNDHLYGAAAVAVPGDGKDTISGGNGGDYLQGNADDDMLNGGGGSDRIQGGQGNDNIAGAAGNDSVNGNLGNDSIDGGDGNDSLRGGQGADSISGGAGEDLLLGDISSDSLTGGGGIDIMTGGPEDDVFAFATGDARFATGGASSGQTDVITDFTDGVDRIHMDFGVPAAVLHAGAFGGFTDAATAAQMLLNAQSGASDVAALRVGSDTYVFYDPAPSAPLEAFRLQGFADPDAVTSADFV